MANVKILDGGDISPLCSSQVTIHNILNRNACIAPEIWPWLVQHFLLQILTHVKVMFQRPCLGVLIQQSRIHEVDANRITAHIESFSFFTIHDN